jgi:chemotaxis protein MotB
MARRRITEDTVHHDRWLVSYADFITLLFAFFVVMYSISQINENKYRVLSNTLTSAFNRPELSLDPFQVGEEARSNPLSLIELDAMAIKERDGMGGGEHDGDLPDAFREISDRIHEAFGELIDQQLITLRGNEQWLALEMSSSLLFDSGEARLNVPALELLGSVADILRSIDNPVRVEGFTDNVPINTRQFPSNWELSTARAASVVQLFVEEGVDPARLAAVGYGEYQPLADNTSPEGRARNRRVVLMISKTGRLRPALPALDEPAPVSAAPAPVQPPAPRQPSAPAVTAPDEVPAAADLEAIKRLELEGGGVLFSNQQGVQQRAADQQQAEPASGQ